jgi:predicted amidohydrolase YtcJ
MRLVRSVIPAEPFAARRDRLAALLRDMAAAGLTGGHVMDLDDDALALYEALDADGQSTHAYWQDPHDYTEAVRVLAQADVQTATHAIGDAAVQHVLDALAKVVPADSTVRHRIEASRDLRNWRVNSFVCPSLPSVQSTVRVNWASAVPTSRRTYMI